MVRQKVVHLPWLHQRMPPSLAVWPIPHSRKSVALPSLTWALQLSDNIYSIAPLPLLFMHSVHASEQPLSILSILLEILESYKKSYNFLLYQTTNKCLPSQEAISILLIISGNKPHKIPLPLPSASAFPSLYPLHHTNLLQQQGQSWFLGSMHKA